MKFFSLLICIFSFPAFASLNLTTTIVDIDYGTNSTDETLVFLGNGSVAKISNDKIIETDLLDFKNKTFSISLDKSRYITQLSVTESNREDKNTNLKANAQYVPTTIASMSVAKKYFIEARYNPKESQCFNRAMVWSYEWWRLHSLKSNKLLIYFTRNYIRRYDFEWWFHIAPLVHVMDNGKVVERMMDIKYARGPLDIRQWTDLFMKNDAPCNVITKYSDYADYPYTGECYVQRTNMYTYQPADLQMEEAWGYTKENFNMNEVRGAYFEAYDEEI